MRAPHRKKDTIAPIAIALTIAIGSIWLTGKFLGMWQKHPPYSRVDLEAHLSGHPALSNTAELLLRGARNGEIQGFFATGSPAFAISQLVPWYNPFILIESNSAAFGIYVFAGPRSPAGFCVFEGERTKLRYGPHASLIASNVFVFTRSD